MATTLEEIAKIAGVSRATASRALHGTYPVKAETKQRLLQLAKELGYIPNLAARSLRTERTYTIGIIIDEITSPHSPRIVRGVYDTLHKNGYASIIINAERNVDTEVKTIRDLLGRSIDGVILVESYLQRNGQMPDLAGKPFVFVHRLFNSGNGNCVLVDEWYNTSLVVEHLISLGHQRIAHITGARGWDAAEERLACFKAVMTETGLPIDDTLIREGNWTLESGYAAAQAILSADERPTAIFAASDVMAIGAIYALQDAGLRVPDDIAVIGYDDQDSINYFRPKLSTVTLPVYDMGQVAAELLIKLLHNPALPDDHIKVQGKLIIRESCGANTPRTVRIAGNTP